MEAENMVALLDLVGEQHRLIVALQRELQAAKERITALEDDD